jgi:hypothetical protein
MSLPQPMIGLDLNELIEMLSNRLAFFVTMATLECNQWVTTNVE